MIRIALLVLVSGCVGAGRMAIRFPDDPDATEETGPISFFCLREGALVGKPTNTLVCIDYKKWSTGMGELRRELQKSNPKSDL